jgi:shikimate kinase
VIRFDMKRARRHSAAEVASVVQALGGRSLVLVGLMGCGKSSVGRRLAATLNLKFVDADEEIELAADQRIAEIFDTYGEEYFRSGERRVIGRLLLQGPQVLATGGGAFMSEQTRENIKARGISIWLKAELPLLMKRVMRRDNRPLLRTSDPEARMRELMQIRHPIYAEADMTVESRDVPHDEMVASVISALCRGPLAVALPAAAAASDIAAAHPSAPAAKGTAEAAGE